MIVVKIERDELWPYHKILPDDAKYIDHTVMLTEDEYKRILTAHEEFFAVQALLKSREPE